MEYIYMLRNEDIHQLDLTNGPFSFRYTSNIDKLLLVYSPFVRTAVWKLLYYVIDIFYFSSNTCKYFN